MHKRIASVLLLGVTLFLAQPRSAKAEDVQILVCTVAAFACPPQNQFANEGFLVIPNNLLRPNRYIVQPVTGVNVPGGIVDPNGFFNAFNATLVSANVAGRFLYLSGTVTVTVNGNLGDKAAMLGIQSLHVDVAVRQNYQTTPNLSTGFEGLSGTCDNPAIVSGRTAPITLQNSLAGGDPFDPQ